MYLKVIYEALINLTHIQGRIFLMKDILTVYAKENTQIFPKLGNFIYSSSHMQHFF